VLQDSTHLWVIEPHLQSCGRNDDIRIWVDTGIL